MIFGHVLYDVKIIYHKWNIMKALIDPHEKKEQSTSFLKTGSATCPPFGFCIIFSLCVMSNYNLFKIALKSVFMNRQCLARCFWCSLTKVLTVSSIFCYWQQRMVFSMQVLSWKVPVIKFFEIMAFSNWRGKLSCFSEVHMISYVFWTLKQ